MDESEDAGARSGVVDKSSAGDLTVAVAAGDPTASCSGPDEGIDDMFNHLELNDDEPDDVVISIDEAREYQQAARWLAIGKVHTNRSFSADAQLRGHLHLLHFPTRRERSSRTSCLR
jgi:hypothetical protein